MYNLINLIQLIFILLAAIPPQDCCCSCCLYPPHFGHCFCSCCHHCCCYLDHPAVPALAPVFPPLLLSLLSPLLLQSLPTPCCHKKQPLFPAAIAIAVMSVVTIATDSEVTTIIAPSLPLLLPLLLPSLLLLWCPCHRSYLCRHYRCCHFFCRCCHPCQPCSPLKKTKIYTTIY